MANVQIQVGDTVGGRYDVLELLGAGGMGAVFRARDRALDDLVALKVIAANLRDRDGALERFRQEVKLARRVTHRNVARTFELGTDRGVVFCTMELVEGHSLGARLGQGGRIESAEATYIARELCAALAAAHAVGVVHRDVKPGNVILALDGTRVVLADFGIAELGAGGQGERSGTPGYMAPEQALGHSASPSHDIYAVGVVLYEMLTGRRAFPGTAGARGEGGSLRLSIEEFGPTLSAIIARATATDPRDRFATALEVRDALARLEANVPAVTVTAAATTTPRLEVRTVVVLPPRTEDPASSALALGLHELVLERLQAVPRLRVLARASAFTEPAEGVVELVAGQVLTLSLTRPHGPTLVLRQALLAAELEVAAETFAAAIARAVLAASHDLDAAGREAIELTLRAREILQRDLTRLTSALPLLERAYELLPSHPRVIAALAALRVRMTFLRGDASSEQLAHAAALVHDALAAGPEVAHSHLAAGTLKLACGQPADATRHFRAAVERAPFMAEGHAALGPLLIEAGAVTEGLARIEEALAISPALLSLRWDLARVHALAGDWDMRDRIAGELAATGADRSLDRVRHGLWRRDLSELIACEATIRSDLRNFDHGMLAIAAVALRTGSWTEHRDQICALAARPASNWRRTALLCQICAELAAVADDHDTAFRMIEHAMNSGMFDVLWLEQCPILDGVRDLRRYRGLHRQVRHRADAVIDAFYGEPASSPTGAAATVRS